MPNEEFYEGSTDVEFLMALADHHHFPSTRHIGEYEFKRLHKIAGRLRGDSHTVVVNVDASMDPLLDKLDLLVEGLGDLTRKLRT